MDLNSIYIGYFYFLVPIIANSAIWIKTKIKGLYDIDDSIHYSISCRNRLLSNAMDRLKKKKIPNQIPSYKLSFFSHQVAGHTDEALRGYRGKVLKPCRLSLAKRLLFMRELAVYEEMYTFGRHNIQSLIPFTPPYHGALEAFSTNSSNLKSTTILLESKAQLNNSGNKKDNIQIQQIIEEEKKLNPDCIVKTIPYLILDDLCSSYKNPCIIDIKMGTQTFEPTASVSKKERELLKYKYQSEIGFRIAGFQVYDIVSKTNRKVNKKFGRSILPHQVSEALSLFFFNGIHYRREIIILTIQKLEKILLWMRSQTNLHFYCSSILIIYDGNENNGNSNGSNCNNNNNTNIVNTENTDEKEEDLDSYHFMNSVKDLPNAPPKKNIIRARNIERMIPLDTSLHNTSVINDAVKISMIDFAHSCKQPISVQNTDKINSNLPKKTTSDMKTSNSTPCVVDEGYIHGLEVIFISIIFI